MKTMQVEDDLPLWYEYEGRNSSSGSLEDICAAMHEEERLVFLDDLGPQFKTLANLCYGFEHVVESASGGSKTVSVGFQEGAKAEGVVSGGRGEAKSSASMSSSSSASTVQKTSTDYRQTSTGASSLAGTQTQTLLLQQPTVYLAPTPVYVVEPQPQPTLLLAAGPMLGVQESNVILLENAGTNMALADQSTIHRLGLQHGQANILVGGQSAQMIHGISGVSGVSGVSEAQGGVSSSLRIIQSRAEPVQIDSHSIISEGPSVQAGLTLGDASGMTSTLALTRRDVAPAGAQQTVRKETISVVEKSFKSASAT